MAQQKSDLFSRLADRGEQMVGRITDLPGAKQLVDRVAALAKGLDDVQKQMRGLDRLEKRMAQIEKRIDKLEGKTTARKMTSRAKSSSASKSSSAPKSSSAKRPAARRRSA
jgi:DNA anti-recombination protein RmuC